MTTARPGLAVLVAAVALAGCGRDSDRTTVKNVAEGFYAAVRDHDGARACALLSADTRKALEQQESAPCARAVEHLQLSGSRAAGVRVYSTEAGVYLRGGDTVLLQHDQVGWRIAAAGCRPQAHGQPADCELQA